MPALSYSASTKECFCQGFVLVIFEGLKRFLLGCFILRLFLTRMRPLRYCTEILIRLLLPFHVIFIIWGRICAERKDKSKNELGLVISSVCSALKWKQTQTSFQNGSGTSIRLVPD